MSKGLEFKMKLHIALTELLFWVTDLENLYEGVICWNQAFNEIASQSAYNSVVEMFETQW